VEADLREPGRSWLALMPWWLLPARASGRGRHWRPGDSIAKISPVTLLMRISTSSITSCKEQVAGRDGGSLFH
jgi:hypothetical protein